MIFLLWLFLFWTKNFWYTKNIAFDQVMPAILILPISALPLLHGEMDRNHVCLTSKEFWSHFWKKKFLFKFDTNYPAQCTPNLLKFISWQISQKVTIFLEIHWIFFVLGFCKIFVFYQRLCQVFIQSSIQTADLKAEEVLKLVANISYQNTG